MVYNCISKKHNNYKLAFTVQNSCVVEKCSKVIKCSIGLIAKIVVSSCAFSKLQRNFRFFCTVNHLSGPLRKHVFTCHWCISIHCVCFCVSRFVACDRPASGNNQRRFFWSFLFLSLARIEQCLSPALAKSPIIITISFAILEQSRVILSIVFAGQAERVCCIVICINSAPNLQIKWLTEQKNPFKVCKSAAQYNKFGYNFLPKLPYQFWWVNDFRVNEATCCSTSEPRR